MKKYFLLLSALSSTLSFAGCVQQENETQQLEQYDDDGSGCLDRSEAYTANGRLRFVSPARFYKTFSDYDRNGDQCISADELR